MATVLVVRDIGLSGFQVEGSVLFAVSSAIRTQVSHLSLLGQDLAGASGHNRALSVELLYLLGLAAGSVLGILALFALFRCRMLC
jgi:hypothetical protein